MVKKPFLSCAITVSTDGSDDDIHCFMSGQPCQTGVSLLDSETCKPQIVPTNNGLIEDAFASDTDEEEGETIKSWCDEKDEEELEGFEYDIV